MPRAFSTLGTSQAIATGTSGWKTILQYTAPAQGAVITQNPIIEGDNTASSTAKPLTRLYRGGTGTGTSRSPSAKGSNNPAGVGIGTGKENFTIEPSGGVDLPAHLMPPYGPFAFPERNIVLAPNETISIQTNATAAINVTASFPEIET